METSIEMLKVIAFALTVGGIILCFVVSGINTRLADHRRQLDDTIDNNRTRARTERNSLWDEAGSQQVHYRTNKGKIEGVDQRLITLEQVQQAQNKEAERATLKDEIRKEIEAEKVAKIARTATLMRKSS